MKKQHFKILALSFLIFTRVNAQSSGDIIITEFMADPLKVSDANGEWFEIYNTASQPIDMNGWHILVGTKNHTVNKSNGLLIQPGSFLLFSVKADSTSNGGIVSDYAYSNITFPNTSGKIAISNASGLIIDSVAYSSCAAGKSWSLDPGHFKASENDFSANWCAGNQLFGSGDFGTPKKNNSSCTASAVPELYPAINHTISVNNSELIIHLNELMEKQSWDIVDISGKVIQSGYITEPGTTFSIPLNRNNMGIYFFRFNRSGLTFKFIVK